MATQAPNILILGAGESGIGAGILAIQHGYRPLLFEEQSLDSQAREALEAHSIPYVENRMEDRYLQDAQWLIKSPGIPPWHSAVESAKARGVQVIGEIEFASWFTEGKLIGVTGTNGKTTTVGLLHQVLTQHGLNAGLAGNTGAGFARQLAITDKPYWVLELSSFQLEDIDHYHNALAILLNITPDHLNRYPGGMDEYRQAKFRITANQKAGDYFIYNADNELIREGLDRLAPEEVTHLPFSLNNKLEKGAFISDKQLWVTLPGSEHPTVLPLADLPFEGRHQLQNVMAISLASLVLEVTEADLLAGLKAFKGIAHRMEAVEGPVGIPFINDSKGTNLDAVYQALSSTAAPIIWIAGGQDKGNDYSVLQPLVEAKVKTLIALGVDTTPLESAFEDFVPVVTVASMEAAVKAAFKAADSGDTVLLSPGCASFDLFENFQDRGDQFKKAVKALHHESKNTLS